MALKQKLREKDLAVEFYKKKWFEKEYEKDLEIKVLRMEKEKLVITNTGLFMNKFEIEETHKKDEIDMNQQRRQIQTLNEANDQLKLKSDKDQQEKDELAKSLNKAKRDATVAIEANFKNKSLLVKHNQYYQ